MRANRNKQHFCCCCCCFIIYSVCVQHYFFVAFVIIIKNGNISLIFYFNQKKIQFLFVELTYILYKEYENNKYVVTELQKQNGMEWNESVVYSLFLIKYSERLFR